VPTLSLKILLAVVVMLLSKNHLSRVRRVYVHLWLRLGSVSLALTDSPQLKQLIMAARMSLVIRGL